MMKRYNLNLDLTMFRILACLMSEGREFPDGAAVAARYVTKEVVTNRAGIVPFSVFSLGYQYI